MNGKFSPTDTVEWRKRTVNAVKALGRVEGLPESLAQEILDALTPVMSPSGPTSTSNKAILFEILKICEKAEQISWLLGEGRATFQVALARKGQVVEQPEDPKVELVAMEGRLSPAPAEVGHTVFGGLKKTTLVPGGEDVVVILEKPQVVGYYASKAEKVCECGKSF